MEIFKHICENFEVLLGTKKKKKLVYDLEKEGFKKKTSCMQDTVSKFRSHTGSQIHFV